MTKWLERVRAWPPLPEVLVLGAVYAFLLSFCTPDLIFSDTMLTGGDSASWLQPLEHLRNTLLPQGRLFGWSLSNFFGYNEGQYYFPVPFVTGALLSYVFPPTIALKLVTLAGLFALPAAFWFTARRMFTSRSVQLVAPVLALVFLCNESYTMFGGNFLSTFAGEFCYSWATAFFVLFLGALWKAMTKPASPVAAGALLALVGLCHTFVFLVAFLMPFFFAFTRRDKAADAKRLARLGAIYALGLAGSAFWFLPMVATRVWAASIPMFWEFASLQEFLVTTMFPVLVAGAAVAVAALWSPARRSLAGFVLFGFGACVFLFFASSVLEVPDIRFVPPALVLAAFAALLQAQRWADLRVRRGWRVRVASRDVLTLVVLVGLALSFVEARNLSSWYRWNYLGYEARDQYAVLPQLTRDFGGTSAAGRFLWEKPDQRDSADFGSERVFENLSHFTGRGTSEGIHYGSSFLARTSTYLQSEYSLRPVDPEAERIYSMVNPSVWPLRFAQLNARDIIVFSDEIKALFAKQPEFERAADYGKFVVYRYKGFAGRYTEVLPDGALSVVGDSSAGFKTDWYRWFRDYELVARPFVSRSYAAGLPSGLPTFDSYDALWKTYQATDDWKAWKPDTAPITAEDVQDLDLKFTTSAVGKPHLIKVAYSPNFRSLGGEKLYPVSPGFLLVYPAKADVEIVYDRGPWEWAGLALTVLAFPLGWWLRRERSLPWPRVFQAAAMAVFFGGVAAFGVLSFGGTRQVMADYRQAAALAFKSPESNMRALELLAPITAAASVERYDNQLTANALLLQARLFGVAGRKDEMLSSFQTLEDRYRHSRMLASIAPEIARARKK